MSKGVKKLGADKSYKRPKVTYQEQLTADEIAEKLQGYERVEDISEVPINTHLRYFKTDKDGTQKFCSGGFLSDKKDAETYVYLTNGKQSWPVQMADSPVFFRKLSHKEEIAALHNLYKKKLQEKDAVIKKLKKYIKLKKSSSKSNK